MQHGIDFEADARALYCEHMLCAVDEVAFVEHPTIRMSGASPDGCIGDDGLCEIKCPSVATHIETLIGQKVPEKYRLQMLWQMSCTGRAYCDFVSYCPSLPPAMQLFVQRVPRDDEAIAELEREVTAFLAEVDETVAKLKAQYETQLEEAA
jgi:NAD-dependent dihydropyrimidine dehydrogenase PreA subunit